MIELSNCCSAKIIDETDICSKCKEHCEPMQKEEKGYILKKDCPNIGKEIGDYYNNEYAESIEELIKKGVIEEEVLEDPTPKEPEWKEKLEELKKVGVYAHEDVEPIIQSLLSQKDKEVDISRRTIGYLEHILKTPLSWKILFGRMERVLEQHKQAIKALLKPTK